MDVSCCDVAGRENFCQVCRRQCDQMGGIFATLEKSFSLLAICFRVYFELGKILNLDKDLYNWAHFHFLN